ncbi:Spermidine/putrescine transport system permease protein PotB [Variovorax sp. PBS-H4]|uniref:ABC transporter permease n=1 Tax=Variovorax sp. PBS-H4 TaxID=434008 RepID=UPI00131996B6|nr:ABC transporter permease [Variovorax sp. PBS-H4]VTU18158.1 Spermidine/putrescine transport system permease protein PotB [Variovorax sp. PBS-H4]
MSTTATPVVPVHTGNGPPDEVPSVRVPRAAGSLQRWLLLAPALLVLGVFAIALLDLLNWSFYSGGKLGAAPSGDMGWGTYTRILGDPLYMGAILATVRLSAVSTVCSLALGLPVAYWIVRTGSSRVRALLIILVAVPFMTSLIVRLYALLLMLGNSGLLNTLFQAMGWIADNDFVALVRNEVGVSIGLTYFVLPFVIFTLAGSFRRYDRTLEDAAQNLGADEVVTFVRITLPLLAPGILAACTLAFVLAGTAFATPLILGGSAVRMVANVIYDQALFAQNMPVAAALSVLALLFTIACLYAAGRLSHRRKHA